MPRESHDREDLLAEAKALVERVSLQVDGCTEPIVIGFRRDRSASFYLSADCVYQFNVAGQLRRAFVDGLIFKAERRQLISLDRQPGNTAVELVRHALDAPAKELFLKELHGKLGALHHALAERRFRSVGQVPEGADVVGRVTGWLDQFVDRIEIADAPGLR